jgi:hypothetical protein
MPMPMPVNTVISLLIEKSTNVIPLIAHLFFIKVYKGLLMAEHPKTQPLIKMDL